MTYKFGVYGDSIALGYGNYNISWFDKLYSEENAIKLAQNGEKIANILSKIKNDDNSYHTLIFAVGINDLLQASPYCEETSFSDLLVQYENILRTAKNKADKVVVQSVLPVREELFPHQDWLDGSMWARCEVIVDFNADLAQLCKKLKVDFVDFYPAFSERDLADLYSDAVHLNNKGQVFLKELYRLLLHNDKSL